MSWDPPASKGDALKQLKIKAVNMGANGVIDITFDKRGTDTWGTNCWESVQASGTAVIFKKKMIFLDKLNIIINNAQISSFLETFGEKEIILQSFEDILEKYCETMKETLRKKEKVEYESEKINKCIDKFEKVSHNLLKKSSGDMSEILDKNVKDIRSDLCSMIVSIKEMMNKDLSNIHVEKIKETVTNELNKEMAKNEIKLDYIKEIMGNMFFELKNCNKDSNKDIGNIKQSFEEMFRKIQDVEKYCIDTSLKSSVKQKLGEDGLFESLSDTLKNRDGYVVEKVNGQAHSCDILVKRETYPSIRIESKAHGRATSEKVRTKEVNKFKSDLIQLNNHGIFVSLYSNIVGKGELELEQLTNGKFAVYLANNRYNVDLIVDMIQLLYKIDSICSKNNENGSSSVVLTNETMARIQTIIKDNINRVIDLKSHLNRSISIVNEIELNVITDIITGQFVYSINDDKKKHGQQQQQFECCSCGKFLKTNAALISHQKKCTTTEKVHNTNN